MAAAPRLTPPARAASTSRELAVRSTPATRRSLPYADYVNWPTPEEIAAVAYFLLSDDSGVINGAEIPVYGRA